MTRDLPIIRAAGLISSLGPLVQACAAFRAGITRILASSDLTHAVEGEGEPQPVKVCEIPIATFGFSGIGRLVSILCEALKDLGSQFPLAEIPPDIALFLALPDPMERGIPVRPEIEEDEQRKVTALGLRVLDQALENLGLKWNGRRQFFGGGHAAFAHALEAACEEMSRGALRSCIVAGIGSLVAPDVLERLLDDARLKTGDNPVGFIPGEAGAAFFLEATRASLSASSGPDAWIRSVKSGYEPRHRGTGLLPDGRSLADCVLAALEASTEAHTEPVLIGDHNGEQDRAMEWGNLQVHLAAQGMGRGGFVSWFPSAGFGDTGAASGAVGLCVALRALKRGYSPSPTLVILSSAETGERAAIVVSLVQSRRPSPPTRLIVAPA